MIKIGCIADQTRPDAVAMCGKMITKHSFIDLNKNLESVDIAVVFGGDGFLLHSIHNLHESCKTFYGVNYGTVGFLLNSRNLSENDILSVIGSAQRTDLAMLNVQIESENGQFSCIAMNEVSILRETGQVAKIKISIDGILRMEELVCDGVVLSTSAGSTAYNFSLNGPIFSNHARVLSLCPVSSFRPRHWRGALISDLSTVEFEILDKPKRPASATVDFKHFANVSKIKAFLDPSKQITLLFDAKLPIEEKILREQFEQFD